MSNAILEIPEELKTMITEDGKYRPMLTHDDFDKVYEKATWLVAVKDWKLLGYYTCKKKHIALMECTGEQFDAERRINEN